jgi:TetR/AcrR family transcriptional repressor of mexCD-oprJ operon
MSTRKQAALEAATRLLAANPRASMQEIAAAAGISRATLHRYFPSRDTLVEELGLLAFERIEAAFASARLDEGTAVEALGRLVEALLPSVQQFAWMTAERQLEESEPLMTKDRSLDAAVERLLRRGQAEGSLRTDMPIAWLGYTLSGLLLAGAEATRRGYIAPRDFARLVLQSYFAGVGYETAPFRPLTSYERIDE